MLPEDTPVPEAPARFRLLLPRFSDLLKARPGRPAGDRGKESGPGDPNQRQGLAEFRFRRGDILVGDVDLGFQGVQLGIVIDFPPCAPGQLSRG